MERPILAYDWGRGSLRVADRDMLAFLGDVYRENRYLEDVSNEALDRRLHGLVAHIVVLGDDAAPSFVVPNNKEGIAFVELITELEMRGTCVSMRLGKELERYQGLVALSRSPGISEKLRALKGKKCLFKYTQSRYAESVADGQFRMRSAASYNTDGFNIAIKDDELSVRHQIKGLKVQFPDGSSAPIIGNQISARAYGDYYVSCFSADFDLKLFGAFESDCCVVIANGDQFVEAVKSKTAEIMPNYTVSFGPVEYVDVLRQLGSKKSIEFRKSSDFSYEKERRFVVAPRGEQYQNLTEEVETLQIDP